MAWKEGGREGGRGDIRILRKEGFERGREGGRKGGRTYRGVLGPTEGVVLVLPVLVDLEEGVTRVDQRVGEGQGGGVLREGGREGERDGECGQV